MTVRIEIGTKHSAHVYGDKVWAQAVAARIPHALCPWCRVLIIPADRAQDLATFLELRHRSVIVDAVLV